jgi:hypothetical protein
LTILGDPLAGIRETLAASVREAVTTRLREAATSVEVTLPDDLGRARLRRRLRIVGQVGPATLAVDDCDGIPLRLATARAIGRALALHEGKVPSFIFAELDLLDGISREQFRLTRQATAGRTYRGHQQPTGRPLVAIDFRVPESDLLMVATHELAHVRWTTIGEDEVQKVTAALLARLPNGGD